MCVLMVVKQRSGFGYETLVREVSDSLHLRRFCLMGVSGSAIPTDAMTGVANPPV